MNIDKETLHWFAIGTSYQREMKLKRYFEEKQMECFVPTHTVYKERNGKPTEVVVPLIHNLLFVKSDYNTLKDEKLTLNEIGTPFRWKMDTMNINRPIIIPEPTMQQFMQVCNNEFSVLIDLSKVEKLKKGDYVEVTDGPFKGVRGYYSRPMKHKCVVVLIDGVAAACTTYIPPYMLRKIEDDERKGKSIQLP